MKIDSIRDLKWILNDYFRLRSEEIGKQELSHSLSLSYGPEIERMYKQLEVVVFRLWMMRRQFYLIILSIEKLLKISLTVLMKHTKHQLVNQYKTRD